MFSEISNENVKRFEECNVKSVVTISPHCYNTFINEYPGLMLNKVKVQHYTQFLSDMMDRGMLALRKKIDKTVVYQDPCYLGKRNDAYEEPRRVLRGIPGIKLVEMNRNRRESLCCGGGGDVEISDRTVTVGVAGNRVAQAQATGAQYVLSACQQCRRTLQEGARQNKIRVRAMDIVELVWRSMEAAEAAEE